MQALQNLINIDKEQLVSVYLQIANGLIAQIRQGILKPGSSLPSSRNLAKTLNVHRKTVIAAYDELYAQSWVDVYPRKGIFVSKQLPDVSPRKLITKAIDAMHAEKTLFYVDENKASFLEMYVPNPEANLVFNDGFPDTRLVPVDLLIREYRRFANYRFTPKYLMYGPEQGSENLRTELSRFLGETRGLNVSADNILITKGAQMAMYLTAQVLLNKNDIVIVGEPGYDGANEVFEQAGAQLALVPVDEHGIDLDAVEAICKKKKVRMLYVVPHHHHPTTVTLSSERRMRLLELAMKYRFAIIEDDYDFDFHYASSPILPLASVDYYGNVVYIGSFCKTIAPAIRIGFMVAPKNLITQVTRLRKLIDRQGEQLLEEAMANLLKNGDISRHLKRTNKIYHERRDLLCNLLKDRLSVYVNFKIPHGGFAIWLKYLNDVNPQMVSEKAARMGLTISNGKSYFHDKKTVNNAIRLGFASLNPIEMKNGVDILYKAVRSCQEPGKIRSE